MSKTIRNCYYERLTYERLYAAYVRACQGKANKPNVIRFSIDLETNLANLYECLYNNKYMSSSYKEFIIYEPKERIIRALPFRYRVVHQWYIEEFIKPFVVPRFIRDSYACIIGRGTHGAVYNLQKYMRCMQRKYGSYYVIKFDISKYFYSIDKSILYEIMKKYISDKDLLNLTYNIIFDNDFGGIPIGNYTSQYFANIYLNELDYFIKFSLGVKYYVRYMDDFIVLVSDKESARRIFFLVEEFIFSKLNLKLNRKSRYYPSYLGIDFCGYKIYESHKVLRKRSINGMRKKFNLWFKNKISYEELVSFFVSWKGHAKHSDCDDLISFFESVLF